MNEALSIIIGAALGGIAFLILFVIYYSITEWYNERVNERDRGKVININCGQYVEEYSTCDRLFPHPECPDCDGTGYEIDGSECPCLTPDPHESVCPKCGNVMGMMAPGEYRCLSKECWQ